eukprot:1160533-Pelagomonas_calceolata.AAC.9
MASCNFFELKPLAYMPPQLVAPLLTGGMLLRTSLFQRLDCLVARVQHAYCTAAHKQCSVARDNSWHVVQWHIWWHGYDTPTAPLHTSSVQWQGTIHGMLFSGTFGGRSMIRFPSRCTQACVRRQGTLMACCLVAYLVAGVQHAFYTTNTSTCLVARDNSWHVVQWHIRWQKYDTLSMPLHTCTSSVARDNSWHVVQWHIWWQEYNTPSTPLHTSMCSAARNTHGILLSGTFGGTGPIAAPHTGTHFVHGRKGAFGGTCGSDVICPICALLAPDPITLQTVSTCMHMHMHTHKKIQTSRFTCINPCAYIWVAMGSWHIWTLQEAVSFSSNQCPQASGGHSVALNQDASKSSRTHAWHFCALYMSRRVHCSLYQGLRDTHHIHSPSAVGKHLGKGKNPGALTKLVQRILAPVGQRGRPG